MHTEVQKKILLGAFVALVSVAFVLLGPSKSSPASPAAGNIERGKYLVEEVAKCQECHTPRSEKGDLRPEAWLQGAPIWISPVKPIANWADRAPAIAGLPGFTEEQAMRVLQKGTGPEGEVLRPPMHIYHMNQEDAKAIVAYLKSLRPEVH
ncbi:MAG: cytochrome c [Candidatus Acidiferrum sp.]